MSNIEDIINEGFEQRNNIATYGAGEVLRKAVNEAIAGLDRGELRVAEKKDGEWVVNQWLKKAVLLSFALNDNHVIEGGFTNYYDKVKPKFESYNKNDFTDTGARVVPPAMARYGSFVADKRCPYAQLRQYRRLRGLRHNGGYLGHGGFLRPGRQKRTSFRRRRLGGSAGTVAGQPDHHRRPLFYRGAFRDR